MASTAASALQMAATRPCVFSSRQGFGAGASIVNANLKKASEAKLTSACHISLRLPLQRSSASSPIKSSKVVTKAMAEPGETKSILGLPGDLKGKKAFIAGVDDDNGYGWAIAKSLAAAGAEILVGTWVPDLNTFKSRMGRGEFDKSRMLPGGFLMEITKVYPLDALYDCPEDVPEDVKTVMRAGSSKWTAQEVVESVKQDFGSIDILVHSLADGPEVNKPLLETSRKGYLAAISASSYSHVSLLKHFLPIMNPGGSSISLTYIASEKVIPGYGGGMSSAKAVLESDTRVLAFEAGRKKGIRVNTISAGPLRSQAAKTINPKAIKFIHTLIDYCLMNAPLQGPSKSQAATTIDKKTPLHKESSAEEVGNAPASSENGLSADEVGNAAASLKKELAADKVGNAASLSEKELFADEVGNVAALLASPRASAITGAVIYVDNGLNVMGVDINSPIFEEHDVPGKRLWEL